MKKHLILFVILAAVLLTGCKKDFTLQIEYEKYNLVLNETHNMIVWGSGYESLEWSSSDESVVTVDENGVIKGVGFGVAYVRVTARAKGYYPQTLECKVIVKDHHSAFFYFLVNKPVAKYSNFSFTVDLPSGEYYDLVLSDTDFVALTKMDYPDMYKQIYNFISGTIQEETDRLDFMKEILLCKKELTCSVQGRGYLRMNFTMKGPIAETEPETFNALLAYSIDVDDKPNLILGSYFGIQYSVFDLFMNGYAKFLKTDFFCE